MSIGPPIPGIAISKYDVENSRSRSWVMSKLKVTTWIQHSVDSHRFHSMSIGHPIPELLFFIIWPWKSRVKTMGEVTVQSHNVGLTSYRLTSLSFHVNRASHSWVTTFSKLDLKNQGSRSRVSSQFKVTTWIQHSVDSYPFHSISIGHPIPELLFFKIWPWKSRVKVMGEVAAQSHNVCLRSHRLTLILFHVNWASHSWVTTFSRFDLENQGSRSWVRSQFKVTMCV